MSGDTHGAELRPLDGQDRAVLAFERQVWKYAGAKETAVREQFGMNYSRYHQLLDFLIDHPDAEAYDAVLVRRLRRLRTARRAERTGRRRLTEAG